MEHLLQKSKCSIFHYFFKCMIFQRRQKVLWSNKTLQITKRMQSYQECKELGYNFTLTDIFEPQHVISNNVAIWYL